MLKLGGGLLEGLLDLDSGHRGARLGCDGGHLAEFADYREKTLDTVLGPVRLRRAYYPCADCGHGRFPKDEELGVAGSSLSPGLRRMVDRVGSQEPLAQGSRDLAELAGLHLTGKRVERSSEADGSRIQAAIEEQAQAVLAGKVIPLLGSAPIPKLYVAMDGTGVPAVPADTVGHPGKSADGRAHTREVKLGCLFTQTTLDEKGHPVRDPLFVGSGAVEAGCRAVVAQRLKLSGMRWSVRGAAAIVTLRCQASSHRWDEIWQWLPLQTTVA